MSLYFKWSCDFHRFTKSKTLRISGSHYTRFLKKPSQAFSLFNLQGTIRCFSRTFQNFSKLFTVLGDSLFSISGFNRFVKNFFFSFQTFSTCAASYRSSLIILSNREAFVKKFFQLFIYALFDRLHMSLV